jgi:hypothetical protein
VRFIETPKGRGTHLSPVMRHLGRHTPLYSQDRSRLTSILVCQTPPGAGVNPTTLTRVSRREGARRRRRSRPRATGGVVHQ